MRDDTTSSVALAAELRAFLGRMRVSLDEEIRTYPTPIPRCDAQFNFVYEQRARVSQWLNRVDAALTDEDRAGALAATLAEFLSAQPIGASVEEKTLRDSLAANMPKASAG
jgi:hypothetical protein